MIDPFSDWKNGIKSFLVLLFLVLTINPTDNHALSRDDDTRGRQPAHSPYFTVDSSDDPTDLENNMLQNRNEPTSDQETIESDSPGSLQKIIETTTDGMKKTLDITKEGVKRTIGYGKEGVKQSIEISKDTIKKLGLEEEVDQIGKVLETTTRHVIKRRTFQIEDHPFTIQGLPIVYPWDNELNYGFRVQMYDIKNKSPYTFGTTIQMVENDQRFRSHNISFDYPAFLGNFRLKLLGSWVDNPTMSYFEGGNESSFVLVDQEEHLFGMRQAIIGPSLSINLFGKRHFAYTSLLFQNYRLYDLGQLITLRLPYGIEGRNSNLAMIGYNYDTRDNEFMTKDGVFSVAVVSWHDKSIGSDYEFVRFHVYEAFFESIDSTTVIADKIVVDWIVGDSPFFEETNFVGYSIFSGVGGVKSVRGFAPGRFADKVKFANQLELRVYTGKFTIKKHEFAWYVLPFLDFGRVWSRYPFERFSNFHFSGGLGLRIVWNQRFIIRFDGAFSEEGFLFNGGFGSTF